MRHHLTMQTFFIFNFFMYIYVFTYEQNTAKQSMRLMSQHYKMPQKNMHSYICRFKYKLVSRCCFFRYVIFTSIQFFPLEIMFHWGKFEQEILCTHFAVSNDTSDSPRKIAVLGRNSGWSGVGMLLNLNVLIFRAILNDSAPEQLAVTEGTYQTDCKIQTVHLLNGSIKQSSKGKLYAGQPCGRWAVRCTLCNSIFGARDVDCTVFNQRNKQ